MKLCLQRRQLKFPMIGHPTNLFCCVDVAALLLLGWPTLQTSYCIMLLWLMVMVCLCATDTLFPMWPSVGLDPISSLLLCFGYLCVFSVIVNLVLPDCWLLIIFTCGPFVGSFGCGCHFFQIVMLCITIISHTE